MTVPEMAVSGFVVNRQYVRMDAPEDSAFAGFWVEVRQNLTNGERKALIDALRDIGQREDDERSALLAEITAAREETSTRKEAGAPVDDVLTSKLASIYQRLDTGKERYQADVWSLIAPHIRAWNAVLIGDDDAVETVPAPADGGTASFASITTDMQDWLATSLLIAYRSGKGVTTPLKKPGDSPPQQGGPKRARRGGSGTSRSPASLSPSASPMPSTFQA